MQDNVKNSMIANLTKKQIFTTSSEKPFHRIYRTPITLHFNFSYLQEFINNTDILPALSTDHPPLLISLLCDKSDKNGNGFWKFNSSLVCDEVYLEKMKKKMITKNNLINQFMENVKQNGSS